MRITRCFAQALGLCLLVSGVSATANNTDGPDLDAIRAQQVALQADARAGSGIFEEMTKAERDQLVSRQSRLLGIIDGKSTVDDLDDAAQVEAFNLLEEIKATVTRAEDSQLVCEWTRKTGSHRKVKQCMTVGERRQLRQDTQDHLQRENLRGMVKDPLGG